MTGIVAAVRCNFCSRQLPAFRVHAFGTAERPAQRVCDDCLDWHMRALGLLAGEGIPPGCQGCGATRDELMEKSGGVEYRLYVAPRDGIYQVLCRTCILPYTAKRRDLYGGTSYGATLERL
jgi:hypothetical protein